MISIGLVRPVRRRWPLPTRQGSPMEQDHHSAELARVREELAQVRQQLATCKQALKDINRIAYYSGAPEGSVVERVRYLASLLDF